MMEKIESQVEQKYLDLAQRLDELQASKNGRRGVSCIRGIISSLRAGRINEARAEASNDGDKIRNYSDIEDLIREELFDGESYPYSNWYRKRQEEISGV